jgi:hypothetical protein
VITLAATAASTYALDAVATAAGVLLVATEIAKEAPYYAGAFGAAVLTESVSSTEALLFLAGANLGAAGYEYVLARLTRGLLGRSRCASFDTDWVPQQYLADYYTVVEPDERETIAFFADAIKQAPADQPVLIFGSGPTLHHVFLAAPHASELHLADYLPANLEEIERWCARDPAAPSRSTSATPRSSAPTARTRPPTIAPRGRR